MITLDPSFTANLAKDVYRLVDKNTVILETVSFFKQNYSNVFGLSSDNIAHSRTGGPGFIKTETAFGLMAYGVGGAKNSAFIILRGTKILADLLTDFNAMWSSTSVQGHRIHDGLSKAFHMN